MRAISLPLALIILAGSGLVEDPTLQAETQRIESEGQLSSIDKDKPFARILLSLEGCGSCASCRADIRQTVKSRSKTKKISVLFGDETVEISYPTPRELPLREIARGLGSTRNRRYSIVKMILESEGEIVKKEGTLYFVLPQTAQAFPLETENEDPLFSGGEIQLRALVKGWREEGEIILIPQFGNSTEGE